MALQLIDGTQNKLRETAEKTLMDYIVSGNESDHASLLQMDRTLGKRADLHLLDGSTLTTDPQTTV